MPTYRPTYDDLKAELRERIAYLKRDLREGREELEWMARQGMQGEPAARHSFEAYERTHELLETRGSDLEVLLEQEERGEEPPVPFWW